MQWPGFWEKDYEITFANIADIVSRYEKTSYSFTIQIKFIQMHKKQ